MTQTVIITGAAKRIGRSLAEFFAHQGWNVVVHYHTSKKEAQALVAHIHGMGRRAIALSADLSKEKHIASLFAKATKEMGVITCLVNNASVFENDDIGNATAESWELHMNANLRAPLLLSQAFAKQLPVGTSGNIINMLDYCVWNLPENFLSYAVSKSGLWTLTQMLARQLAPQIRVNGIGPGHSLPNTRETQERFDKARQSTPLQNGAEPEEICRAVAFLLQMPSMTGQMLALDGGKHLQGAKFY